MRGDVLDRSRVKLAAVVAAALIITSTVSFFAAVYFLGKKDLIFPGVRVADIEIGGLSAGEARTKITERYQLLQERSITVTYPGGRGEFKLKDVGFQAKTGELIAAASSLGRQGSLWNQWLERRQMARNGREIPMAITADKNKLRLILEEMTRVVRLPARNALLSVQPDDSIQIIESADGYGVDIEDAWGRFQEAAVDSKAGELPLKMVAIRPARTTEDAQAMGVNGLIAQYTTRFDLKKTNRVFNIRVAAQPLDGFEVKPGQVFSFNKIVGPRSQEAGYKLAPTILNNEFIDSLGGGVCQVSTTLYNTLLLADVQIVERSSHSLVVRYVPLGQDAAVAYGGKDLRFRNNYNTHLLIKSSVVGNSITFKIYGDTKNKKYVVVTNTTIKELPYKTVNQPDPTLPSGKQAVKQKGVMGYKVLSYRLVYSGGQLIKKEKLPLSIYNSLDQINLTGSGRAVSTAPPAPKPGSQAGNVAAPGEGTVTPVNPPDPGTQPGSSSQTGPPADSADGAVDPPVSNPGGDNGTSTGQ